MGLQYFQYLFMIYLLTALSYLLVYITLQKNLMHAVVVSLVSVLMDGCKYWTFYWLFPQISHF